MRQQRFVFYSIVLFCFVSFSLSDAKILLAPKKRMTKKQRRADNIALRAKQKERKQKQGVLEQPKTKEAFGGAEEQQTMKLEATITKNEKGESILQLTPDSSEVVASMLQNAAVVEKGTGMKEVLVEEPTKQQILFYDPKELQTAAGEPPLPKRVYDANGNEVDMAGKKAILIPPAAEMKDDEVVAPKEMSTEVSC